MTFNKKLMAAAAVMALGLATSTASFATDLDVDATINTRAAISLTPVTDLDFGTVDFAGTHSGTIELGTDGNIALNTGVGLTLSGATTAGEVTVAGDGASNADVSCDTGGTLTDGGANTLTLSATEIAITTGVAFGSGTACAGLGTSPVTMDLSSATDVFIGGALNTTSDAIDVSATYSTASVGGDPVTLRVTYQ